jgi:hypothetical protein
VSGIGGTNAQSETVNPDVTVGAHPVVTVGLACTREPVTAG